MNQRINKETKFSASGVNFEATLRRNLSAALEDERRVLLTKDINLYARLSMNHDARVYDITDARVYDITDAKYILGRQHAALTTPKKVPASKFALDKFNDWADKNKLHVSVEKSSYVLFIKLVRGPKIKWENQPISLKNHLKYLGVTIDHKLSRLPHVIEQGKRAMDQYQHLCRIAGKTWGINKNNRRLLYQTVRERTLCHGAAAWGYNMTSRLQKKLDSIQSLFLLYITSAYRTTPTAALQVVTGHQPLHLQIQQEATYARVARARSSSNFFTLIFSPTYYESKSSGIHIHPHNFLLHNQISFAENQRLRSKGYIYWWI
ncbi:hypothetical protein AVEN_181126-1 [Araneus ventricosus]|uniref:Reverse transcriptase domain-containing protein n=1 Tax=Araneus ventricosus TaxID=182803 RepID=A0A4Y2HLD7_ARAVE|nr:hypothetical protein AVEN_181126-1 [Araneus ventricosus]